MRAGQKVRVRPASPSAREFGLSASVEGVVLCQYKIFRRGVGQQERVDVRLASGGVVWGGAAADFEIFEQAAGSAKH